MEIRWKSELTTVIALPLRILMHRSTPTGWGEGRGEVQGGVAVKVPLTLTLSPSGKSKSMQQMGRGNRVFSRGTRGLSTEVKSPPQPEELLGRGWRHDVRAARVG